MISVYGQKSPSNSVVDEHFNKYRQKEELTTYLFGHK
jgi:hypothetical protein